MAKETTLNEIGEMIRYVTDNMATKEEMATGFAGIMSELEEIKQRLTDVETDVEDHSGHSKEIDHAFERIAAIEQHLGPKHAAR